MHAPFDPDCPACQAGATQSAPPPRTGLGRAFDPDSTGAHPRRRAARSRPRSPLAGLLLLLAVVFACGLLAGYGIGASR